MKKKLNKHLTSFEDHLDKQYGKKGTRKREKYEQGFESFKLGILIQEAREQKHLTQEELDALIEHDLGQNESLKKVRDVFIFSVYTGLRFVDAQQLTMDRIQKTKEGKYMINIIQEKTGEVLTLPLLPPAVKIMEKYNRQDVVLLEPLYKKLLPWIPNHINAGLFTTKLKPVCPTCGSSHLQSRGETKSKTLTYNRYQCQGCGTWSRTKKSTTATTVSSRMMIPVSPPKPSISTSSTAMVGDCMAFT